MIFSLFFTLAAFAAEPKEIWSLKTDGGKPVAAFFDVASSAIYVSVREEGGGARLDKASLEGKLEEKGAFTAKGEAGALRAYGGRLFWVVGERVLVLDPKESGARELKPYPAAKGTALDIALARDGAVYLSFAGGSLWRVGEKAEAVSLSGKGDVRSLFVLNDKLHYLQDGKLFARSETQPKAVLSETFCDCRWLERTSAGQWLTVKAGQVLVARKPVLTLKTEIGRPSYVFRMDTTQDFFVLPLPEQGIVRAYRMPGAETKKKSR